MSAFIDWQSIFSIFSKQPSPSPPAPAAALEETLQNAPSFWNSASSASVSINVITIIAILFGALCALPIFYLLQGRGNSPSTTASTEQSQPKSQDQDANAQRHELLSAQLAAQDEAIKALQHSLESRQRDDNDHPELLPESSEKRIESSIRSTLDERIQQIKSTQESIFSTLDMRLEALEEGVRIIDSKQLDTEASHIAQRNLQQRLEAIEEKTQNTERSTRACSQRIESLEDSVRVIDSRSKALGSRVEAVEDTVDGVDGRATLLAHDVGRGGVTVEKLARQVKMLPGEQTYMDLSRAVEGRFRKLEGQLDEYQTALKQERQAGIEAEEAAAAAAASTLTLSQLGVQEIEPTGPIYTKPAPQTLMMHSSPFDGMPPTPSPSTRSYSTMSSHSAGTQASGIPVSPRSTMHSTMSTYSNINTPEQRKRLDMARSATFSSRQRGLATRKSWYK